MANQIANNAEKFIWQNLKMYLMSYPTCLLDNVLEVVDDAAELPVDRYKDFVNELEAHIGLGSYVVNQASQFSRSPYITVNIATVPMGNCVTRAIIGFDIVFATDAPAAPNGDLTRYVGNSSEAVASFRKNICTALDELFYFAYDPASHPGELWSEAFFDRLRDKTLINPVTQSETAAWKYNMMAEVDDENNISQVTQLKREDRSTQLSVFHVVYKIDINRLYGDGVDCAC